jgi:hypothetical protein
MLSAGDASLGGSPTEVVQRQNAFRGDAGSTHYNGAAETKRFSLSGLCVPISAGVFINTLPRDLTAKANDQMPDDYRWWERRAAVLLVFLVCTLTLGVFVPWLGIYYDDIPAFYVLSRLSLGHLIDLTWGQARPVYAILMWLTGGTPLIAHLLMFAIHTANALLLMFLIRRVLKRHTLFAALVAILYCVYPLYWLHPTSVGLAVDGSLFLCLASFMLGLVAVTSRGVKRWFSFAVALICIPVYFFLYELPFPLEVLRPLLFGLILTASSQDRRQWLSRTARWSAPYLVTALVLGYYRLFVFKASGFYAQTAYNVPNVSAVTHKLRDVISIYASVFGDQLLGTWQYHIHQLPLLASPLALVLGLVVVIALLVYAIRFYRGRNIDFHINSSLLPKVHWLMIACSGLLIMVLGQVTLVATLSAPQIKGLLSRWNLVSIIGVSIFMAACALLLASIVFKRRAFVAGSLILSPMIGIGVILQVSNAQQFVNEWDQQRQFWWQLAWRAPDLEDNTTVIVDHAYERAQDRDVYVYETLMMGELFFDNKTIAVVNTEQVPLGHWDLDNGTWKIGWAFPVDRALLVYLHNECLEIIDPGKPLPEGVTLSLSAQRLLTQLPTHPEQFIKRQTDKLFADRYKYFVPEPPHDECYRYEKSKLSE